MDHGESCCESNSLANQKGGVQRFYQQPQDHLERMSVRRELVDLGLCQKMLKFQDSPEGGGPSLMRAAQEAQRECHRPRSAHKLHGGPVAAHTFLASYAKRGKLGARLAQAYETSPTRPPVDNIAIVGGPGTSEGAVEPQAAEDAARASGEDGCSMSKCCHAVSSLHSAPCMASDVSSLVVTCPEKGVSRARTLSPPQFTSGAFAPRSLCHLTADGRDGGSTARARLLSPPRRSSTPLRFAQSGPKLENSSGNAAFAVAPCQSRMVARRCAVTQVPVLRLCPKELRRMPQVCVVPLPQQMIKCSSTGCLNPLSQHSPDCVQPKGHPAECALPVGSALKRQMSLPRMTSFKPVAAQWPQESKPSGISCVGNPRA